MKKTFLALSILCGMALTFESCKPELKNLRGEVKSVVIDNDTIKSMILSVDGQDMNVNLLDTRFQNGLAIHGDSIILDYIDGADNTLRALVVTVLPRAAKVFEPSDTLITKESKDSIQ